MATPPGGRPYDGGAQQMPDEHSPNRYNFPSTPGGYGAQHPQQPQQPYQPHQPYPPYQQQPHYPSQPYASSYHYQDDQNHQNQQHNQQHNQHDPPNQHDQQHRGYEAPAHQNAHNPLVRPYAMTGGRTRPRYQLAIEALVSTTADPMRLQGQLPEHQRICRLCFEIKSVAEISALLSIPLGVARILVADLAEAGLVAIHQPGGDEAAGGQPDVTLLERVLSGLRKL
ncbi:DUF742 domain-containing protein [Streptomyces sp. NPDC020965]|uniref:DUF742 domain-containing protein n=1 Tax=Streptomyces sp. NPDC020965 TaxID=3365105 RepID=UPI00379C4871